MNGGSVPFGPFSPGTAPFAPGVGAFPGTLLPAVNPVINPVINPAPIYLPPPPPQKIVTGPKLFFP